MAPTPNARQMTVAESVDAVLRMEMVPQVLETVCRVTGMRFAAIARVTDDRWTACAVLDTLNFGLKPGGDLVLDSTICDEIRVHHQAVIFGHASRHPVFSTHHTPKIYGLESYVSVPIMTGDGDFFGTLCAVDSEPRDFEDEGTVVDTLSLFASLIASHLTMAARAEDAERALEREISNGVLREQFLAVVGHDLRNPLQGARLVAEHLTEMQQTDQGTRLIRHLSQAISRMGGLIDDVMDFARGRLGGGIPITPVKRKDLRERLGQTRENPADFLARDRLVLGPEPMARWNDWLGHQPTEVIHAMARALLVEPFTPITRRRWWK